MATRHATALLALWNSIGTPARVPEYETWHGFEHVPERVGLPGFIEARRYRALPQAGDGAAAPLYFTVYWLAGHDALADPAYREVFTNPTPWSARMRTELRDFFRLPCDVTGRHGVSGGSRLAVLHLRACQPDPARLGARLDAELASAVASAQVLRATWGLARTSEDFPIRNVTPEAGRPQPATTGAMPEAAVLLEHFDGATLCQTAQSMIAALARDAVSLRTPRVFELQSTVHHGDLPPPGPGLRQLAQTALMRRYTAAEG